jgi:phospholipase C
MAKPSSPIEHVVVLMLENRSFDHMLGRLPGVNGVLARGGKVNPAFGNLLDPATPTSTRYAAGAPAKFAVASEDISKAGFGGPGHSYPDASVQVYGSKTPEAGISAKAAPLNGFVQNYLGELRAAGRSKPTTQEINEPMSTFTPAQVPVISQLAQEFCVCDQWFSEVPGPTEPNRLFMHAGTSVGLTHNPWEFQVPARTIYEELDKAGRDWAFFFFDINDAIVFPALKGRVDRMFQFAAFAQQCEAGSLPAYSFICPRYNDKGEDFANSQHAPYDIRYGEHFIADVYEALRAHPIWNKTLLVLTYDEHGGYYDHVSPPTTGVSSPDGLTSPTTYDKQQAKTNPAQSGYLLEPDYDFDFTRLGVRVPAVLISPWIKRGVVDSTRYQHTSVFAMLRDVFGIGALTKRDAQAKSFSSVLSLKTPRTDAPATLKRPAMPPPDRGHLAKPLTDRQKDLWPILSHLDGHKDSGKVTAPPPTRVAAQKYIEERLAAHEQFHRARRRKAVYQVTGRPGRYTWQLRGEDDVVLAKAPRTYPTRAAVEKVIGRLRDLAPHARQVDPKR